MSRLTVSIALVLCLSGRSGSRATFRKIPGGDGTVSARGQRENKPPSAVSASAFRSSVSQCQAVLTDDIRFLQITIIMFFKV